MNDYTHLLGLESDASIARKFGVTPQAVCKRRKKAGIEPYSTIALRKVIVEADAVLSLVLKTYGLCKKCEGCELRRSDNICPLEELEGKVRPIRKAFNNTNHK